MKSASRAVPLDRLPGGSRASVVAIAEAGPLADVGIVPGCAITIERSLPFGGPIVLRLGTARVAIGRSVARSVLVEPLDSR
jgi:Fe2+ transport system protein FeoA